MKKVKGTPLRHEADGTTKYQRRKIRRRAARFLYTIRLAGEEARREARKRRVTEARKAA
jgi:hypothetical protein